MQVFPKNQRPYLFASIVLLMLSCDPIHAATEIAGRSLEGWYQDTSHENSVQRRRAAKTVGLFGAEAIPQLVAMLEHEDPAVRYWAASHLGNLRSAERTVVDALKTKSEDASRPVRLAIAYALCAVEPVDRWSRPLLEAIQTDDRALACTAGDFLGRLGPRARPLLEQIETRYESFLPDEGDYHIRGALKNAIRDIRITGELEEHTRPEEGGPPRTPNWGAKKQGPEPRSLEEARRRPNILWISCEDISPNLGCFGDVYASTPNLDRLASQGVRFTQAFTPAGVCAVVRTGIITGMYPIAFGGQHMRSVIPFPEEVKPFPVYLRQAGYFCTNKSKTDYQSDVDLNTTWDRQGTNHSDWRERKQGQPFFSVINLTCSHESQIRHGEKTHAQVLSRLSIEQHHAPGKAAPFLPPIYANTPETRKDWAWYADNISEMDRQAGEVLRRLEEDGLVENTVVIFWSDHGRGLPRGKRWIYDSGVHVPLIVRWPGVLQAGRTEDDLVSTQDLTPTTLALAGVPPKPYMHGRIFLGPDRKDAPELLFFHRDRMDETYELMRAARSHRFKYIRNFEPERTYAQHIDYMDMMPTLVDLRRLHQQGKLNSTQQRFFAARKPVEELYDVVVDPHETINLADREEYHDTLTSLREALEQWQVDIGDLGMTPETIMMEELQKQAP